MSGRSKPKQYVATMHEAFQYVQREWDAAGKVIAGDRGFCAVHVQSVRKSHPSLPIFMNALAGTVLASNGAMVDLWGVAAPIALWVVNVNYSQTRKSGLASILESYASVVDQHVRNTFREILAQKQTVALLNKAMR